MSETKEKGNEINIVLVHELDEKQKEAVKELQGITFTDVDEEEASEDFYHPKSAEILAWGLDNLSESIEKTLYSK